jgi:hypothetical protein
MDTVIVHIVQYGSGLSDAGTVENYEAQPGRYREVLKRNQKVCFWMNRSEQESQGERDEGVAFEVPERF